MANFYGQYKTLKPHKVVVCTFVELQVRLLISLETISKLGEIPSAFVFTKSNG